MSNLSIPPSLQQIPQPALPPGPPGPIHTLPDELLRSILFVTDQKDKPNAMSVSRKWKVETLTASIKPHQRDLQQLIQLLTVNLEKYPKCRVDLEIIRASLEFHISLLVVPAQAERLFLKAKGSIVGVLKQLPPEERTLLLGTIGHQISAPMRNLFILADLTLTDAILTGDFDTFYILFHSFPDLSKADGKKAVELATENDYHQMLHTLLANGFIEEIDEAVFLAVDNNHDACVELLLGYGSITFIRGDAACSAAKNSNLHNLRLLLARDSIDTNDRGGALLEAVWHDNINLELIRLLLTSGPIPLYHRMWAIAEARERKNPELEQLLQADHPVSANDLGETLVKAVDKDNLKVAQLVLSMGRISPAHHRSALRLARLNRGPNRDQFIQLLDSWYFRATAYRAAAARSCTIQ